MASEKVVYGLSDVYRVWYLRIVDELSKFHLVTKLYSIGTLMVNLVDCSL